MHHANFRLLLALLTFTCLTIAAQSSTCAEEMKFPQERPTFTFELPKGWSCEPDKNGNLDCSPGADADYALSILILKDITSAKEVKNMLPKVAKAMIDAAKVKNFELGDIDTDKNGNGVDFTGIRGDGTLDGTKFMVMVHAFEPQKGKWYAVVSSGSEKADAYYEKDYDSITASIAPIEE